MSDSTVDSTTHDQPARQSRRGNRKVLVRYGMMNFVGSFTCPDDVPLFGENTTVIVQTGRGIEIGTTLNISTPEGFGTVKLDSRQVSAYVNTSGPDYLRTDGGRILRLATEQDLHEAEHIQRDAKEKLAFCQHLADSMNLAMELVACEHIFGGERVVFYFMAEGRIDFRELVRGLAREYQTRIEMRQIGARDEARLLADYEICGRECCCRGFLKTLRPVSMKMAKVQKATLDPTKVSGRCGRLRCCLRYEQVAYDDLMKRLPRVGSWVRTEEVIGRVVNTQVLTQLVLLEDVNRARVTVTVDQVVERNVQPPEPSAAAPDEPRPSRGRGRSRPRRRSSDDQEAPDSGQSQPQTDAAAEDGQAGGKPRSKRRRRRRRKASGRPGGSGEGRADGSSQGQGGGG